MKQSWFEEVNCSVFPAGRKREKECRCGTAQRRELCTSVAGGRAAWYAAKSKRETGRWHGCKGPRWMRAGCHTCEATWTKGVQPIGEAAHAGRQAAFVITPHPNFDPVGPVFKEEAATVEARRCLRRKVFMRITERENEQKDRIVIQVYWAGQRRLRAAPVHRDLSFCT